MLEKSFGLLFFLRKPKNYQSGPMYVYIRITVDGIMVEISAKRLWEPSRWNSKAGKAIGNKEDVKVLNQYLDTLKNQVFEAKRILLDNKKEITAVAIKSILSGKDEKKRMILDVFIEHNKQLKELVGREFSPVTLVRYNTSLEHTRSFIRWKYGVEDIEINSLDYDFISSYSFWLRSIRNCNNNTTVKYLRNFKKIVLHCVRNEWLRTDPFINFKMSTKEVDRVALTEKELREISIKDFHCERLNFVKDIFLFSCYTGLSYIEVRNLKRINIQDGIDGELWIFTRRQKTDTPSEIPLLPVPLAIAKKYEQYPQCINKGTVLPILSNQKMNAYLKEIADLCGISKNITFHLARHTFATTVTLNNDVPIESVSKMLGHKSIRQTQHYARISNKKVSEDMMTLRKKLPGIDNIVE